MATGDLAAAGRSASALVAFVIGAGVVGATVSVRGWSRGLLWMLAVEVLLLAALPAWWFALPGRPSGWPHALTALGAAAAFSTWAARAALIPVALLGLAVATAASVQRARSISGVR
ncbi:hypothetical protein ACNAW0_05975 [Micromonospora sp. SL1-18]|uniref:hypothetical protein n=1 Tax=Micromonospora sp. SL1-18 TaxID=3399128 RepID=UPI003A4D6501